MTMFDCRIWGRLGGGRATSLVEGTVGQAIKETRD